MNYKNPVTYTPNAFYSYKDGSYVFNPTFAREACFSVINSQPFSQKCVITIKILRKVHDKYHYPPTSPYSLEQVKFHLDELKKAGFPFELISEDENWYVVELHQKEYLNRTHVCVALDYLRLLWEPMGYWVLEKYFELPVKFMKEDYLAVLGCLYRLMSCTGHQLPGTVSCSGIMSCQGYGTKSIMKQIKEHGCNKWWMYIEKDPMENFSVLQSKIRTCLK